MQQFIISCLEFLKFYKIIFWVYFYNIFLVTVLIAYILVYSFEFLTALGFILKKYFINSSDDGQFFFLVITLHVACCTHRWVFLETITIIEIAQFQSIRIDAFELWYWRRLLRVPRTARRSNQSILKEISPGCSLEGLMLNQKLQYFGHLIRRADSLEKTLMLGRIEGRRRRG